MVGGKTRQPKQCFRFRVGPIYAQYCHGIYSIYWSGLDQSVSETNALKDLLHEVSIKRIMTKYIPMHGLWIIRLLHGVITNTHFSFYWPLVGMRNTVNICGHSEGWSGWCALPQPWRGWCGCRVFIEGHGPRPENMTYNGLRPDVRRAKKWCTGIIEML